MKRVVFITVFVALLLPAFSFAGDVNNSQQEKAIVEGGASVALLSATTEEGKNVSAKDMERSGCCSWHDGVCGCQNGRALCCDGTLSPSCGCD